MVIGDDRGKLRHKIGCLPEPARTVIAELDAAASAFVAVSIVRIQTEVASFARVPHDELVKSMSAIIDRCFEAFANGYGPSASEFVEAEVIHRRVQMGIPVEDVLRAYRYTLRLIRDWIMAHARTSGVSLSMATVWMELLWDVDEAGQTRFGALSLEMTRERAQYDEQERADFIYGVLFGQATGNPSVFGSIPRLSGSTPETPYHVMRARRYDDIGLRAFKQELEKAGRSGAAKPLLIVHDGDVLGLTPVRPSCAIDHALIAVSEKVKLSEASGQVALVGRVLDAAEWHGLRGTYDLDRLGILLAVAEQHEVGRALTHRYLAPLEELGDFGEVLISTLDGYIDADCDLYATAKRLFVHFNTVRHRLHRAEEILAIKLSSRRTVHELWWALTARQHVRPGVRQRMRWGRP